MRTALAAFFDKCNFVFDRYRSDTANLVGFPVTSIHPMNHRDLFERAIGDVEKSDEFEAFIMELEAGPLSDDIERLADEEVRRRKRVEANRQIKFEDLDKFRRRTAKQAGKAFFRNTGFYVSIWQGSPVEQPSLLNTLDMYAAKRDSELIRLFVFDGFVAYDNQKRLSSVRLPTGELNTYTERELEDLFRVPQSIWHRNVSPETIKKAASWHIFTIRKNEQYRGMTGIWINDDMISPIDWSIIGEPRRRESDISIIGPIFLCIGEDVNLAVEIRVRTNPFEYSPIQEIARNDYLPWDSYDEEGEAQPRTWIKHIGEAGKKLIMISRIWHRINDMDKDGHLRYPTEAYVRSVMNVHASWEGLLETFVGFVTVIESLLTPGTRQELTYKMAIRGASILDSDPEVRMQLVLVLDGFYKIRSSIVHEGRTGKDESFDLNNMISNNLSEIARQIIIRYICLLNLALDGSLPTSVLPDPQKLLSRSSRPEAIARILDSLVLNPNLTQHLEQEMGQWAIYEDWKRTIGFALSGKRL